MEDNTKNECSGEKLSPLYIILLLTAVVFMGIYCFLMKNDSMLYIFGRLFRPYIFMYVYYIIFFGQYIYLYLIGMRKEQDKEKKKNLLICTVISTFMVIVGICGAADNICDGVKDPPYFVSKTLSDGTVVLFAERTDYIAGFEKKPESELTYFDIYRLKGFAAAKIGDIDESYFSNRCLAQDKYILDYDENSKTLTVACEYGVYGNDFVHLKEEFDTGVMTYEFILL